MSARSTKISYLCFLLLFSFSTANATEWHRFERDDLALHLAHTDAVRAGEFLNALLIGRNEIRRKLGGTPEIPIAVYLAPNEAIFRELTHGRLPHWSAGVAFLESRTIVLQASADNLLQVARHEFAHIFLHAIAPSRVPVWFHEGVAMWASHEWRLRQSAAVFYAVFSENLIPLSEIDEVLSFPSAKADLAYTESLLAVSFLIRLGGPNAVVVMLSELEAGAPFEVALFRVTGETPREFERRWRDDVQARFSLMTLLFSPDLIWLYLTLLLLLAYICVRLRNRATLRRWEAEDAAEELTLQLRVYRREDEQ
ncbi:MAG: hypothetical protein F4W91_20030 [Gemmatimonadetes bacterium]|nr:hypothetical protein [Gemmatimonadota bacterium]